MLGIENIKEALLPCINLGEAISKAFEDDGKITTWEGIMMLPKLIPLVKEASDVKEIIAEFKDLDEDELEELKLFVQVELDIADDVLEEKIEKGWNILVSLLAYTVSFAS